LIESHQCLASRIGVALSCPDLGQPPSDL
jgi:hypothetical protein